MRDRCQLTVLRTFHPTQGGCCHRPDGHGQAHTRLFETLIRDEYIVCGSSAPDAAYREHVVPLKVIRDHCLTLFAKGMSDDEVAEFVEAHLKIALMTVQEAQRLNRDLGLRTTMPVGWVVGDDVMARLVAARIRLKP